MSSATATSELTPIGGTPVFRGTVLRKRPRATKPKSLATGQIRKRELARRNAAPPPPDWQLAAAGLGAGCSVLWGLAVVAFPSHAPRSQVVLALLAAISCAVYLLAITTRGLRWPSIALETCLPASVMSALALLGTAPPMAALAPLFATCLVVGAVRLSAPLVVTSCVLASGLLAASTLAFTSTAPQELAVPIAWFLLLGAGIATGTHYLSGFAQRLTAREHRAAKLENELGRFVSHDVARAILDGDTAHQSPERRDVSVLFCDLRGFTFMCERERPEDVVDFLNTVYEGACGIIQAHGGSVNKFLGDGLLAIFGAPDPHEQHARAAAQAALEIQQLIRFLRERGGIWTHLALGMGIDSGSVVAGPVGATSRLEYTVIGSCVNRAARLQGFADSDRQRIVLSEATKRALSDDVQAQPLGEVALKGFTRPQQIYALRGISQKR